MGALQTIGSAFVISTRSAFTATPPLLWFVKIMLTSFFTMYFFVLLADFIGGGQEMISYVAIGNAVQTIATVSMYSIANVPGDQKHVGTMQVLMLSPSSTFSIFLGMSIFSLISGFFSIGISLVYAAMFGVDFSMLNVLSILVVIIITALSMSAVGMAIGSVGLYLRTSVIIANIMAYIGLVISGVNFPVSDLPEFIQIFSQAYPLTYAVEATRMAVDGSPLSAMAHELGMMVLLGAIFIVAAYGLFRFFERMSRRSGRMDTF